MWKLAPTQCRRSGMGIDAENDGGTRPATMAASALASRRDALAVTHGS